MVKCSRFLPALILAFLYACIAPTSILLRMGSAGWRWVWNDLAFGFFMLLVFPFAVAVFACVVDTKLLKESATHISKLSVPVFMFVAMMLLMPKMVWMDEWNFDVVKTEAHRLPQPYMYSDRSKMRELDLFHEQALRTKDLRQGTAEYRERSMEGNVRPSRAMLAIFLVSNFLNVGFGVSVFCYILLVSVAGKIGADICNHLIFVLGALAVWFPCRVYADWFINLGDLSWIASYEAAVVILALFAVACIILALRMVDGTLYHRFVVPLGAISAVATTIIALKRDWLSKGALIFEGYDPVFRIGFAIVAVALLYYISSTIHQKTP
ncbi:MAG TPA: hypothetical protein VKT53_02435 [Candidatus Acidoferrum sp.]|nr:hypothetical protein [Candidatus Acidoferrum sp.]